MKKIVIIVVIVLAVVGIVAFTVTQSQRNAMGRIMKLHVKEGEHVKRGQLLAQLESVQPAADVAAQRAGVNANQTDAVAAEAAMKTNVADLNRAKADDERA